VPYVYVKIRNVESVSFSGIRAPHAGYRRQADVSPSGNVPLDCNSDHRPSYAIHEFHLDRRNRSRKDLRRRLHAYLSRNPSNCARTFHKFQLLVSDKDDKRCLKKNSSNDVNIPVLPAAESSNSVCYHAKRGKGRRSFGPSIAYTAL